MRGLVAFLVFFPSLVHAGGRSVAAPDPGLAEKLGRMTPWIRSCLARQDNPEHRSFHGCWDWHSAAHAHWALLRVASVTGDDSGARLVETSLAVENVRAETATLARAPSFENPYGRAWFLRLAIEFERWADARGVPQAARLRDMAALVADSLVAHFREVEPSPWSSEYQNASWAFYQLHAYYDFIGDRAKLRDVDAVIEKKFVESEEKLSFGYSPKEFFSVYGNWAYLVAKTTPAATLAGFLGVHPIRWDELAPISVTTNHSMGHNWSRAWALKALSTRVSDAEARRGLEAAYAAHVERGLLDHERYKNDYGAYGHWVPQFAVYALTEGLAGEPR